MGRPRKARKVFTILGTPTGMSVKALRAAGVLPPGRAGRPRAITRAIALEFIEAIDRIKEELRARGKQASDRRAVHVSMLRYYRQQGMDKAGLSYEDADRLSRQGIARTSTLKSRLTDLAKWRQGKLPPE